jgi:hypothetical protein
MGRHESRKYMKKAGEEGKATATELRGRGRRQ